MILPIKKGGSLVRIDYAGGVTFRAAAGEADISGDYNLYPETRSLDADGRAVTVKGAQGAVSLALWTAGDQTFSLSFSPAVSAADSLSWASAIH